MRLNIPLLAGLATVGLALSRRKRSDVRMPVELLHDRTGRSRMLGMATLMGAAGMLLWEKDVTAPRAV
jgi:hypothetical protein